MEITVGVLEYVLVTVELKVQGRVIVELGVVEFVAAVVEDAVSGR